MSGTEPRVYRLAVCDLCGGQTDWSEWEPGYCLGGMECEGVRREIEVVPAEQLQQAEHRAQEAERVVEAAAQVRGFHGIEDDPGYPKARDALALALDVYADDVLREVRGDG